MPLDWNPGQPVQASPTLERRVLDVIQQNKDSINPKTGKPKSPLYLSVTDYGAVGDGVSDASLGINAAIRDAVNNHPNTTTVFIPPGTYVLNSQVTILAGITLLGAGRGSLLSLGASVNTPAVAFAGTNGVAKDFAIYGNRLNNSTDTDGITCIGWTGCTVDGLYVSNVNGFGIHNKDSSGWTVQNCAVTDTAYTGIYAEAVAVNYSGVTIRGCTVDRSAEPGGSILFAGIAVHGVAGSYAITDVLINDNAVLMPAPSGGMTPVSIETFGYVEQATITGNNTSGGFIGVSCDRTHGVAATGNTAFECSFAGFEFAYATNGVYTGNTAYQCVRGLSISNTAPSKLAVTGNTFKDCTSWNVYAQDFSDLAISGNTFSGAGTVPIIELVNGVRATVTGNIIQGNTTNNVGVELQNVFPATVTGNQFDGLTSRCVSILSNDGSVVTNIAITGNATGTTPNLVGSSLSGGSTIDSNVRISGNVGNNAHNQLDFSHSVVFRSGSGSPESAISGGIGSLYLRRDGSGGTAVYFKENGTGTTGWVEKSLFKSWTDEFATAYQVAVTGETYSRFKLRADGRMFWGEGSSDFDSLLWRQAGTISSPVTLFIDNADFSSGCDLRVSGAVTIGANLDHNGSHIGFFGASNTTKKTVSGGRNNPSGAITSLLTGLADYGLITDSSTFAKPTITGSRAGNAALASLLTALDGNDYIIDGTTV